jgi:hypothetical protein
MAEAVKDVPVAAAPELDAGKTTEVEAAASNSGPAPVPDDAKAATPEVAPEAAPEPTSVPAPAPVAAAVVAPTGAPAAAAAEAKEAAVAPADVSKAALSTTDEAKAETTPAEAAPTPLAQLFKVAQSHGHPEVWGVTIADPATHIPSQIILQKFLNANDGDVTRATEQLTKTLDWRKETKPLDLVKKTHDKAAFQGLGYVTTYANEGYTQAEPEGQEVFTWNVYGNVKDMKFTFGDVAK